MRVAISFLGRRGGGGRYTLELARALAADSSITLCTIVASGTTLAPMFSGLAQHNLAIRTYANSFDFVLGSLARGLGVHRQVSEFVRAQRIDVLIMGMIHPWSPLVCRAARSAGARVITVVHEPYPHPGDAFSISAIMRVCIRDCVRQADAVVALTQASAGTIVARYRISRPRVIAHGTFAYHVQDQPRTLPSSRPVRLLFFGRIAPHKGLGTLLEAVVRLQVVHPQLAIEIWGDGDLSTYANLLRHVVNVRIENRWVAEDEVSEIFRRCDVCVLPYLQTSQSGVIGIAQAAGMPIVAFPHPGIVEQLSHGGGIVSGASSVDALVATLELVLSDAALYASLSGSAIEAARASSWTAIAGEFNDLAASMLTVAASQS